MFALARFRIRLPLSPAAERSGGPRLEARRLGLFGPLLARLTTWQDHVFERAALCALDDRQLADVGLTRADIVAELAKPVWRRR